MTAVPISRLACLAALAVFVPLAAFAAEKAAKPKAADATATDGGATIYLVINDQPITGFTIEQRIKLMALDGGGGWQQRLQAMLKSPDINKRFETYAKARNPQSREDVMRLQKQFVDSLKAQAIAQTRPGLRDKAIEQIVAETLQRSEAKRLGLLATDAELAAAMADMAQRNKKSAKEFEGAIAATGVSIRAFKERIRTQMSWQRVLGQKFRGQIVVNQTDIDQALSSTTGSAGLVGSYELRLQRIVVPVKASDANAAVQGYATAEKLRGAAKPCNNFAQIAKQASGARFEDLGTVKPESIGPEIRPILADAEAGSVPPPVITKAGIEIYGVCERVSGAKGDGAKAAARDRIEKQKFEALSKGVLSDLCASASIEQRNGFRLAKPCGAS